MTEARPRVDVGVVTWNTRDTTIKSLRRLLEVTTDVDIRLLVRDNGSTDGTVAALRSEVPEAEVDPGVDNLGFAAGMNTLLARSDAEWFLCLNSDAWPEAGAISTLISVAERHPRAGAVAPRLQTPNGELELSALPFPSLRVAAATGLGLQRLLGRRRAERWLLPGAWQHDREREVDWVVGAAVLMRRTCVEDIGGFDESFFMYAEDVEWCLRARRRGWEIWFTPQAVVRHVGNVSGEQAYGEQRSATWIANANMLYRRSHGPISTSAYRCLNAVGATRHAIALMARRDRSGARFWWSHAAAHLGRRTP